MSGTTGSAMTTASDSSTCSGEDESSELALLLEAARRANWNAKHGPAHLRTGRFFVAAHLEAHSSARLDQQTPRK